MKTVDQIPDKNENILYAKTESGWKCLGVHNRELCDIEEFMMGVDCKYTDYILIPGDLDRFIRTIKIGQQIRKGKKDLANELKHYIDSILEDIEE